MYIQLGKWNFPTNPSLEEVLPYYSRTYVNVFSVRVRVRIRVGVRARVRDRVREQDPLQGLKRLFLVQLIMYVWGHYLGLF